MFRNWVILSGLAIAVAGCGAPRPSEKINAYLPQNVPVVDAKPEVREKADVVLLAQCRRVREYSTELDGKWVNSWYATTWKVIRIERGKWPQDTLIFYFRDRWPAPGSGILLDRAPPRYYVGAIRAFNVDSRGSPTIVADEARSRIPPHGSVARPIYNSSDPAAVDLFERIENAVRAFVWKEIGVIGAVYVTEQYGTQYVAELRTNSRSAAVVVDGDSLAVRWADPGDTTR
jgi:hypothetical protein